MRWKPFGRSVNVEDRRGQSVSRAGGMRFGIGGFLLLLVLSVVFRQNLFELLDTGGGVPNSGTTQEPAPVTESSPEEAQLVQFVSFVLDDDQRTWATLLPTLGTEYRDAKLVLFRDAVESACGFASAASGPFYCARDEKVYIDLGFYDQLRERFGASGDFAQAYVIAHELGHHVQNLLGTQEQVARAASRNPEDQNDLSVRLELQADCYAGVWAHSAAARDLLDPGDVEEGLGAAAAIGDDRIQRMTRGRVVPESFTHGTSEQRVAWFRRGLESGRCESCDTFARENP